MSKLVVYENAELWVPNEGGQTGFMNDYMHFVCAFVGGWFSGKTWAGARKLADQHVWNALADNGQPTYIRSMAIAQTFPLARTQTIPELQQAFDEMGLSYRFVGDAKRYCFELLDLGTKKRPSEILIRSAESPETINSFTVGAAWGDEAARWPEDRENPKNDPMTQLIGRVRDPKAKVLQINLTFTHEGDLTRVFEDLEENPKPDHVMYRAHTTENPYARDFARRTAEQLSPELAEQYLAGFAMKTRGNAMYSTYDKVIHRSSVVKLVPYLPLQLSVDFNISPGMHAILGQYDDNRDHFTARHLFHEPKMAVPEMVDRLDQKLRFYGWKPGKDWPWAGGRLQLFGDASGGSEHASRGESCWDVIYEILNIKGIPYTTKIPGRNPNVADRVNAMNMAFKDGRSRSHYSLFWAEGVPSEHQEMQRLDNDYRKMKWNAEGDIDKKNKKLSHPSDAEGYRVNFLRPIKEVRKHSGEFRDTAVTAE